MFKIIRKFVLGPKIQCIVLDAPLIAKKAQAGQFVIVRVREKGERIPLTIADFDRNAGTITIVFQELGKSTRLFGKLREGDFIPDLLGPQGNPTEVEKFGNVAVVGGGIGVAAIYPLLKELKEKANFVITVAGYKSKDYVFWEDKISAVSDRLLIMTDDGSYGRKGLVTDLLKEVIGEEKIDRIFAIGPTIMMKAVSDLTKEKNIRTIVSLNSLMVCGMGMCGACRVTVGEKTHFTCMDGPDFDGHFVNFDELMKRLETYKSEESE